MVGSDSWVCVCIALLSCSHVKQFFQVTFHCIQGGGKSVPIIPGLSRGGPVLNPVVNDCPRALLLLVKILVFSSPLLVVPGLFGARRPS